ncbi:hypothetical protein Tco_0223648 [Tanacetum coccineum]
MEEFTSNDKANYYSRIASIVVNGKRAYELKGKFLDDFRDNSFCGTNEEDAMEHIEYFLKIVDPINLPNVNYERLRRSVFLISLVESASKWFDEFKASITSWTYEDYENELNDELEEPWSEDGVPYEISDHICEFFSFNNGKAKWPPCNSNEDGFCNGGELLGMVRVGYMTYFQDYEWNHIHGPYTNYYRNFLDKEEHENEERCELFDNPHQETPIFNIRRFEMIKYSSGEDKEFVAIKECGYDDLIITNEDACRTYQEIFRRMGE